MYNKNLRIKMSESRAPSREPSRETISLLVLSIIGGLALTRAIIIFQEVLSSGGYSILSEPTAYFLIFLSVWYRFIPGNIAHIRKLERHPTCSVGVWLLDISIMMFESMILTFMSEPSARGLPIFFSALAILLSLDVIWVFLMLPGVKKGTRPSPPQTLWLIINIPSIFLVITPIISSKVGYDAFFGPKGAYSLIFLPIFFLAMAFIDICRSGPEWFGRHVSKVSKEEIDKFMQMAIDEAKKGLGEGGIPIGAVLVKDDTLLGIGHNRRVQDVNPIAHAEIECLKNAGRVATYKGTTLYSTLMPCSMCAGAIVQFGINRVVVGESRNYIGARTFLESCGVEVTDLDNEECRKMMENFKKRNPNVWKEDIGTL
jgi:cytosine deaminase